MGGALQSMAGRGRVTKVLDRPTVVIERGETVVGEKGGGAHPAGLI